MALFIMGYKVALMFESVDKTVQYFLQFCRSESMDQLV